MHTDGGGVQNGVEGLRAEHAARNRLPADGTGQFLRGSLAPGADADLGSSSRQGKCSGARRAAGAEDQHAAAPDAKLFLKCAKHAEVIRVAAVQ